MNRTHLIGVSGLVSMIVLFGQSSLEMRVGTIEFTFEFKKMHRLGDGEIEEYLLTEQNTAGRSSWDFRILDSNGRRYEITRNGTTFELKRD